MSHSSEGIWPGSGALAPTGSGPSTLLGKCPSVVVNMGGVNVPRLLDTGSMVTTVTESFFLAHFEPWGKERLNECGWLQLRAANGLSIPFVGYLELDFVVLGRRIHNKGVLVVKDPPQVLSTSGLPGRLGMNVIGECFQELFNQHGQELFNLPVVKEVPAWTLALQCCQTGCFQGSEFSGGPVRARGKHVVRIPANSLQFVPVTCAVQCGLLSMALYEPLDNGNPLPSGLLASVSLVPVRGGITKVPMVNIGELDVFLQPQQVVGTLCQVQPMSWPGEIVATRPGVVDCQQAVVSSQVGGVDGVEEVIQQMDLSHLSEEEQNQVRGLLGKYRSVFSTDDSDLGCTNLIAHEIPLLDSAPIGQRYRRIPPSDYVAVKDHVQKLLASQVIRESSSPFASPIVVVKKKMATYGYVSITDS